MELSERLEAGFTITIEVVPPVGPDPESVLLALESLSNLSVDGFSVATNPVAKPCMSAMALCALIQKKTGRTAVLHCTTRDQNRLSLQGKLWGAKALGIHSVLMATGDMVAYKDRHNTTTVRDFDVMDLIRLGKASGLFTGAVFDTHPESDGLERETLRLKQKVEAGADYIVTQPVYDLAGALQLEAATRNLDVPVILGILPLRTPKHAMFLHEKVAGIAVPETVRAKMVSAQDPIAEGAANAREMLAIARQYFAGACIMPPFNHYEVLFDIL